MILRTSVPSADEANSATEPWAKFVESQNTYIPVLGYISQPAHAALSGRLAAALNGTLFGQVPEDVIAAIGNHDAGWAQLDLAALEDAVRSFPLSFISMPAAISVSAWHRSIAEAVDRLCQRWSFEATFACLHPETGTPNTKYSGNKRGSTFKERRQRSHILPPIKSGLSTSRVFATCFRCSCALDGLRKFRCHSPILHRRMRSK